MFNKLIIGALLLVTASTFYHSLDGANRDVEYRSDHLPQIVEAIDLNKTYEFAGERMPDNFDTRERLDRELTVNAYWQSSTILNLKAAQRYFPVIEPILLSEGIPLDFKYLAVAESNLRHVTSPANAKGFWQFRKAASKGNGIGG